MKRAMLVGLVGVVPLLVLACSREPAPTQAPWDGGVIAATVSVDEAFSGCAHSCGSRSAKDRATARAQPGVGPGETTFCPVSGAVFMIRQDSAFRDVVVHGETKRFYFCCESCAKWFDAHQADVLAKRGLA
jgi:hypothetical protein